MKRAPTVIDVQESFQQSLREAVSEPATAVQVNRLITAARDNGDLVVCGAAAGPAIVGS